MIHQNKTAMTPEEIEWRCRRMDQLLTHSSRMEAIAQVRAEAHAQPWLLDPRPAPRLATGTIHDGPIDANNYVIAAPRTRLLMPL